MAPGLALGLDGIYRRFTRHYERLETNRVWNDSGGQLDSLGGYRNGRAQTVSDLETPEGAYRRYVGATFSLTRREGPLKARAAYTWSRLDGTVLDGLANRYGDIGPRDIYLEGPLADDHRHELKALLSYRVSAWMTTSLRYTYYSGLPYSRVFRNDVTGQNEDYRARAGINPRREPERPQRRPSLAPPRPAQLQRPDRVQLAAPPQGPSRDLR